MRSASVVALTVLLGMLSGLSSPVRGGGVDFADVLKDVNVVDEPLPAEEEWFTTTALPPMPESSSQVLHQSPLIDARVEGETPMVPLPPALLLAPLGIAMVGYASYRLKKRGGI